EPQEGAHEEGDDREDEREDRGAAQLLGHGGPHAGVGCGRVGEGPPRGAYSGREGRMRASGILLGLAVAACASSKAAAPQKPKQPVEKVFDVRGDETKVASDGTMDEHVHVWEQTGIHPYQV